MHADCSSPNTILLSSLMLSDNWGSVQSACFMLGVQCRGPWVWPQLQSLEQQAKKNRMGTYCYQSQANSQMETLVSNYTLCPYTRTNQRITEFKELVAVNTSIATGPQPAPFEAYFIPLLSTVLWGKCYSYLSFANANVEILRDEWNWPMFIHLYLGFKPSYRLFAYTQMTYRVETGKAPWQAHFPFL